MLGVDRMVAGVLLLGKGRIRAIHEPIGVLCVISLMVGSLLGRGFWTVQYYGLDPDDFTIRRIRQSVVMVDCRGETFIPKTTTSYARFRR